MKLQKRPNCALIDIFLEQLHPDTGITMRNPSHLTHPEKHYRKMVERADLLSDVIGSSKKHPLLNLFELTSELIRAYDLERFDVPNTKP